MYFEVHGSMADAIQREKRVKRWRRAWKIELIDETNPEWRDLWQTILGDRDVDSRLRGNDGRGISDETKTSIVRSSTRSEWSRDER